MTREQVTTIRHILFEKGYRQMKFYLTLNGGDCKIEIHSNAIVVEPNVEEIKKLIGDGYSVSGDTKSELITIK